MTADWAMVWWTAGLTIATILLAIVAAFQDSIREKIRGPKLKIKMTVESPHCHRATSLQVIEDRFNNRNIKKWQTYYFRFQICNDGKISAKNVELILKDVQRENGESINLPLDNLEWSTLLLTENGNYVPRMYWKSISPKTYQYCNLGYIMEPEFRRMRPEEDNPNFVLANHECLFAFNV